MRLAGLSAFISLAATSPAGAEPPPPIDAAEKADMACLMLRTSVLAYGMKQFESDKSLDLSIPVAKFNYFLGKIAVRHPGENILELSQRYIDVVQPSKLGKADSERCDQDYAAALPGSKPNP
jgi:hypothetical protein